MPGIATLDTGQGQLRLQSEDPNSFMEVAIERPFGWHAIIVSVVPLTREQAETMGRLLLAHAAGPRPIGDVLAPVLERAGVTQDMLAEGAQIVPGGVR